MAGKKKTENEGRKGKGGGAKHEQGRQKEQEEEQEGEEQTLGDLLGCGPFGEPWIIGDDNAPTDEQEAKIDALCDGQVALDAELQELSHQIAMQTDPEERMARIRYLLRRHRECSIFHRTICVF